MSLISTFGFGDSGSVVLYSDTTKILIIKKSFSVNFKEYKFYNNKIERKFGVVVNQLKFSSKVSEHKFTLKVIQLKFKKACV